MLSKDGGENLHTGVDGLCKVFLLALDDAGDVLLLLAKLGILAFVFVDNSVNNLIQEGLIHAEQLTVACSSAQKPAQDIASALV